jgi:nanoRNase/pAp phosphatase (c-di-AMP/oligoRNAs hydrolase)
VNSFVFDSVINQYDVFVRCVKGRDTGWMCSITTEKSDIDVSVIAKRFGGGGHVKAAGFRVEKLEDFFVKDVI